jgi:hypothetical protein
MTRRGLALRAALRIALCLNGTPVAAHDVHRPDLDGWYESLRRPNAAPWGVTSCCSIRDCHQTEAERRGSDWWARLGLPVYVGRQDVPDHWNLGPWVRVPAEIILKHNNPTGDAVICHQVANGMDGQIDPTSVIWCFVLPDLS